MDRSLSTSSHQTSYYRDREYCNFREIPGPRIRKKMLAHATETAQSEGFHTLEIGTGNSSLAQLGLYQKCGFSISGIDFGFFLRNYSEPIWENGIQCKDMVRLSKHFS